MCVCVCVCVEDTAGVALRAAQGGPRNPGPDRARAEEFRPGVGRSALAGGFVLPGRRPESPLGRCAGQDGGPILASYRGISAGLSRSQRGVSPEGPTGRRRAGVSAGLEPGRGAGPRNEEGAAGPGGGGVWRVDFWRGATVNLNGLGARA